MLTTTRCLLRVFISVSVAVAIAGAVRAASLTDGLIAEYPFDEGAGTVTTDIDGASDGTLIGGAQRIAGKVGGGVALDGVSGTVRLSDSIPATGVFDFKGRNFTMSAWVYVGGFASGGRIMGSNDASDNFLGLEFTSAGSGYRFQARVAGGSKPDTIVTATSNPVLGRWYHVVAAWNKSKLCLYVDGVLVASKSGTSDFANAGNQFYIGSSRGVDGFSNVILDDVRLYNRAFSDADAAALYANGANPPPDTTKPTVTITAPAHGNVQGSVTIAANASDAVGVAGVTFYVNGAAVGAEDTSAPYQATWNTLSVANGNYNLTAVARDAAGNATISPSVGVTVANPDIVAPTVAITAPAVGSSVHGGVTITATATDDVGVAGVTFYVDGTMIGASDNSIPYSVGWNTAAVPNGTHSLTAIARDAAGNTTTSAAVVMSVNNPDTTKPTVSITAPAKSTVQQGIVTITANANDLNGIAGVAFYANGLPIGGEDTSAPFQVSWNTLAIPNGNYSLTAVARDSSGNIATSSTVGVTVNNADSSPPTVAVTAPAAASVVRGSVTVTATATDASGVAGVKFYANGVAIGTEDTTAPYQVTWNTVPISNGTYALTAVARDTLGNTATSAAVSITVSNPDVTLPTVAITAPAAGSANHGFVTITASANDNVGVAGVTFYVNGVAIDDEDTAAPYSAIWDTSFRPNGTYTLTAVARDAAHNTTTSAPVSVTVSNPAGVDLASDLKLLLRFEERTGLVTGDSAVPGRTASLISGTAWAKGKFGSGLFFDGIDDNVSMPDYDVGEGVGAFTISVWVKANFATLASTNRGILGVPASGSIKSPFCIYIQRGNIGGRISFNVATAAGDRTSVESNAAFNTTDWTHIACVYDGAHLKMYVNGALQNAQPALTGTTSNPDQPLRLNYSNIFGELGTFGGVMDELLVYHRALNASEITALATFPDTEDPFVEDPLDVWIDTPLTGSTITGTQARLAAAIDDSMPATNVQFYIDGAPAAAPDYFTPYTTTFDTTAYPNGGHVLTAVATSPSGVLATSPAVMVQILNLPDTTPPLPPAVVVPAAVGANQINVAWTAAQDDGQIASYDVYRGAGPNSVPTTLVATKSVPFFADQGLAPSVTYTYSIVARDAAGNVSGPSAIAQATTPATTGTADSTDNRFSFTMFSDNYSGQESGVLRIANESLTFDPNLRSFLSAGDTPTYQRVRTLIDSQNGKGIGTGPQFPWFPTAGNHDVEDDANMIWWASTWAVNWAAAPATSPLALQLPGITRFRRGPLQVVGQGGSMVSVDPGTIYSFDYKNAHFLVINTYEQGIISDSYAGVWDQNGPGVFDPTTSQLDWIAEDLSLTTKPVKFAIGHNALVSPNYSYDLPPAGWSEHNGSFHLDDLVSVFSQYHLTAYFFGHDHVASRALINQSRTALYERLFWTTETDPMKPFGSRYEWESLQGPGTFWQVDTGRVFSTTSFYTIVRVSDSAVTFETYRMPDSTAGTTFLWDTFSVPVGN